jgi:hypothetical protein
MSRQWADIIILTVVVLVVFSAWEIYKTFTKSKDIGEYEQYATSISRYFDEDLLVNIKKLQEEKVLIKDEDIAPK